jgi:hypothetical protein
MTTYSTYDANGYFTGRTFSLPAFIHDIELHVEANANGLKVIEGAFDSLSQRVNLATGEVEDFQPPQPNSAHEWNADTKRWELTQAAQAAKKAEAAARAELIRLDAQSVRYVAEGVAGVIDDEGKRRLAAILARKAELRRDLYGASI